MVQPIAKRTLVVLGAALLLSVSAAAQGRLRPEQIFTHPKLDVVLPDFPAQGLILDIGGGGEGVIGQLKGKQVVAIDLSRQELDEAPGEPLLKIVMDAYPLRVKLPKNEINTGYGVRFREGQGADHFAGLAGKAGFQVVSRKNEAGWFFLELKKTE
jgi:hypothetical protein